MNHREVMQQALRALEQCGLDDTHRSYEFEHAARASLRTALAEPEHAPAKCVAPLFCSGTDKCIYRAEPQPLQPVAWMDAFGSVVVGNAPDETFTIPLYPAPQRQRLTEDEAWDMWEALADRGKKGEDIVHAFARAVEKAHGITGETK